MKDLLYIPATYPFFYIFIVFLVPWFYFMYWVYQNHIGIKRAMGNEYTGWSAFRKQPSYAAKDMHYRKVFKSRNKAFVICSICWVFGSIILFGSIFLKYN